MSQETSTQTREAVIDRNREVLSTYWKALTGGHIEQFAPLVHEDAVFHYPGNHVLSGDYHGKEAVVGLYTNLLHLSGHRFQGTLHEVVVGEIFTVAILSYRFQLMPARTLPGRACGLFRIEDGTIREYWLFEWDQSMINDVMRTANGGLIMRKRGPLAWLVSRPRAGLGVARTAGRVFGSYKAPTNV